MVNIFFYTFLWISNYIFICIIEVRGLKAAWCNLNTYIMYITSSNRLYFQLASQKGTSKKVFLIFVTSELNFYEPI